MSRSRRRRTKKNSRGTLVVLLVILLLALYGTITGIDLLDLPGLPGSGGRAAPSPAPTTIGQPGRDWYSIYFTDPGGPEARTRRGGPDALLAEAIREARLSVDIAVYDLNLWSLRDALRDAHRLGVAVRVVTDSDNLAEPEIQALEEAGIPVLGDRRESLMHHKFVIIDRLEVWTGSMNFTLNGAYENNNNLVRIRSFELAENYLVEFEEMFLEDQFGAGSPANTPHASFSIDGTRLETYFSPEDDTAHRLVELIEGAQESVYFLAYAFTSDDIADAMLARARAGVIVSGIFDESQYYSNQGTEYDRLKAGGLDVRLDGNRDNLHHKVLIIDGQTVVTGSYNFSANAENRNDENTLILHDPQIAAQYMGEFEELFQEAKK